MFPIICALVLDIRLGDEKLGRLPEIDSSIYYE